MKYLWITVIITILFTSPLYFYEYKNREQEKWISSLYSKYCYLESQVHKNIKNENKIEFKTLEECNKYLINKNK